MAENLGHARGETAAGVVVQVVWSRRALTDLAAIWEYIHQYRPRAADRMAERLTEAGFSLADHGDRGRAAGRYREFVAIAPYVIRYRVTASGVHILRIKHGARRPG